MVTLERIFDLDIPPNKYREIGQKGQGTITLNLGTPEHPQEVNIENTCTPEEQKELKKFLSQYKDVIAWSH